MDKKTAAMNLFTEGANCSQAVLGAFAEECGLTKDQAFRLAAGFGGGFARQREVCGTVSGMVLVANLLKGPGADADKDAKDAHYALIRKLCDTFKAETGSIVCRELLGLAPKQIDGPVSSERTPEFYKKRPCKELAGLAAEILEKEFFQQTT